MIVTEKMDGENTTLYSDHIHARSIDGRNHPSRNWVKNFWSNIKSNIPVGWRVCGENLFAKHSIGYDNLDSYFFGFSIWDNKNVCLAWDTTVEWFELLGIKHVPVLYDGLFNEDLIKSLWSEQDWQRCESYVVRDADIIKYSEFRNKVGKYVRANHIQTIKHWLYGQPIEKNNLTITPK